jgi:hypothetical protein
MFPASLPATFWGSFIPRICRHHAAENEVSTTNPRDTGGLITHRHTMCMYKSMFFSEQVYGVWLRRTVCVLDMPAYMQLAPRRQYEFSKTTHSPAQITESKPRRRSEVTSLNASGDLQSTPLVRCIRIMC